jgi:hypothetical protein
MESKDDLTGTPARLPDGQRVKIVKVYDDGYAIVRRVEGERKYTIAECSVEKLLSDSESIK